VLFGVLEFGLVGHGVLLAVAVLMRSVLGVRCWWWSVRRRQAGRL
jgi:hypothetical protein